jgi:PPK2 family polyphosphate:nucleotide phosphotransferase
MDRYRIAPGTPVRLAELDARDSQAFDGDRRAGRRELKRLARRIGELQNLLHADGRQRMLIVLQGMDASGKDSTIRDVFSRTNPLGMRAVNFRAPSEEELRHDYLWRVHDHAPSGGQIAVFNRSHYGDVLVVRVHDLVPPEVWARRYDHINEFERMLADEGATILKFFLHISKEAQWRRLQQRLADPAKHWKLNSADLRERRYWDDYQAAYEEVLSRTSAEWAPWYVVPADRRWYRKLVVASIVAATLEAMPLRYPDAPPDIERLYAEEGARHGPPSPDP